MTANYSGITFTIAANSGDRETISARFKKYYPGANLSFVEAKKTRPAIRKVEVPDSHPLAHAQVNGSGAKPDLTFREVLLNDAQDRLASLFAHGLSKKCSDT